MAVYFVILPRDLIFVQALYLNYPDSVAYFRLSRYAGDALWDFKIANELRFAKNQYLPTLFSRQLKFLELKSIREVDFGSEHFLTIGTCVERTLRLENRADLYRLLDYFTSRSRNTWQYGDAIRVHAIATDDEFLLQKYPYSVSSGEREMVANISAFRDLLTDYETRRLLENERTAEAVIHGFIRTGNLGKVRQLIGVPPIDQLDKNDLLGNAGYAGALNVVDYFLTHFRSELDPSSLGYVEFVNGLIRLGYTERAIRELDALPIEVLQGTGFPVSNVLNTLWGGYLATALDCGIHQVAEYLVSIHQYQESVFVQVFFQILPRNHVDSLEFIRKRVPHLPSFESQNEAFRFMLPPVFDFLRLHGSIPDRIVPEIYRFWQSANSELATHIEEIVAQQ